MIQREEIEWMNYWIQNADSEKKRILLIGDSVTRELRKWLNLFIEPHWAVDLVAMSFSILENTAYEEIKHFLETQNYSYEYIIYHLGCHHGYYALCSEDEKIKQQYEKKVEEILCLLRVHCKELVVMSATPEREKDEYGYCENHNREIEERNAILHTICQKEKYKWLDMYRELKGKEIEYTDWCHFRENTYEHMADRILTCLFHKQSCISPNYIMNLNELKRILTDQNRLIYIYGNAKRAEILEKFFGLMDKKIEGYIVSNEYYREQPSTFRIEDIEKDNILVFVTPTDRNIWKRLCEREIEYYSISKELYAYIQVIDLF